jgi:hypothetical protein
MLYLLGPLGGTIELSRGFQSGLDRFYQCPSKIWSQLFDGLPVLVLNICKFGINLLVEACHCCHNIRRKLERIHHNIKVFHNLIGWIALLNLNKLIVDILIIFIALNWA